MWSNKHKACHRNPTKQIVNRIRKHNLRCELYNRSVYCLKTPTKLWTKSCFSFSPCTSNTVSVYGGVLIRLHSAVIPTVVLSPISWQSLSCMCVCVCKTEKEKHYLHGSVIACVCVVCVPACCHPLADKSLHHLNAQSHTGPQRDHTHTHTHIHMHILTKRHNAIPF